jgi:hypothetical protein
MGSFPSIVAWNMDRNNPKMQTTVLDHLHDNEAYIWDTGLILWSGIVCKPFAKEKRIGKENSIKRHTDTHINVYVHIYIYAYIHTLI